MPNLYDTLRGMDPEDAEAYLDQLESALQQQQLQTDLEATAARLRGDKKQEGVPSTMNEPLFGSFGWMAQEQKKAEAADAARNTPAFDPAATQVRMDQLSEEYERLSINPAEHIDRMETITKEIDTLLGQQGQYNKQIAAYNQSQLQPEKDAVDADLNTLSARLQELYKDPASNYEQIQTLKADLETRLNRSEQIQRGDGDLTLKWNG